MAESSASLIMPGTTLPSPCQTKMRSMASGSRLSMIRCSSGVSQASRNTGMPGRMSLALLPNVERSMSPSRIRHITRSCGYEASSASAA